MTLTFDWSRCDLEFKFLFQSNVLGNHWGGEEEGEEDVELEFSFEDHNKLVVFVGWVGKALHLDGCVGEECVHSSVHRNDGPIEKVLNRKKTSGSISLKGGKKKLPTSARH